MHTCDPSQCPICKGSAKRYQKGNFDAYVVVCERCGEFEITHTALVNMRNEYYSEREVGNISGWLRENQRHEITSYNADDLKSIRSLRFVDRVDRLLCRIGKESVIVGAEVKFNKEWVSYAWCANENELRVLLDFFQDNTYIKINSVMTTHETFLVQPNGWMRIDELGRISSESEQGFVAMWFNKNMSVVYVEAISKAIEDAGYRSFRVDNKEHSGKIDDEIVAEIRKSRFVVADFTCHRGGVYYEAGFAKGLGLEVFWTCRDVHFKKLHFDIRQYNCIKWSADDLDGFRRQLHYRIESVMGRGPVRK